MNDVETIRAALEMFCGLYEADTDAQSIVTVAHEPLFEALAAFSKPCPRRYLVKDVLSHPPECICRGTGEIMYERVVEALWQRHGCHESCVGQDRCEVCQQSDEIIKAWEESDA